MDFLRLWELFTWLHNSDLLDRNIPFDTQIEMYDEYGDYLTMGLTEEEGKALADEFLEGWKVEYPRPLAA